MGSGSAQGLVLGLLVAVFIAAFTLYVREETRGGPWRTHVLVSGAEAPDAAPQVARLYPGYDEMPTRLRSGDRLLRAGELDLKGANAWTVYARFYAEAGPDGALVIEAERDGRRFESLEHIRAEAHFWRDAALAACFAVTALLLLWRVPGSRMVRSFAAAALVWAIAQVQFQGAAPLQTYAYFAVRSLAGCLWAPLMILSSLQFPQDSWPADRRLPRWPWLFAVLGLTWTSVWSGTPFPAELGLRANPVIGSAVIAAVLAVMTRNYRRAGPVGRRQVKWIMLGCYLGMAPSFFGSLLGAARPELMGVMFATQAALVAIPVSILIAVTRTNWLDIDRLISGTASYTILLVAIGVVALTAVPWLAEQASARAGLEPAVTQLALAAVLAFARLEPQLRPRVELLFFAERQAFQAGIDRLVAQIHQAPSAAAMATLVGDELGELLRPEFSLVYARGADAFAPIFVQRCAITPHFELDGGLVAALSQRVSALDLEREHGFVARGDAAEQAALESLDASLLVPIVRDRTLLAFIVLGPKGSGDIYTPTDLALLGMVGTSISASISRFDDQELLGEARELQEKLRRYVPASIAAHLVEGRDLEDGEREVSVLFADLQGYTSLAEGRRAQEVFDLISDYTETVTRAVTAHQGTVVEFNGDGMMAVFGAPDPLPGKERCALAAARQIVAEVGALEIPSRALRDEPLHVGVGLATGLAYVGAIRCVDRHIWSAIGNTTNLAARLQSLTRELGAPIVIDEATHAAASEEAADFAHRGALAIRGLRAPCDVFLLPRSEVRAA